VVLSQVFAHHKNLGYDQYGTLHLAEVDRGGNVESEAVEGDGGAGGEVFLRFRSEPHGMALEQGSVVSVTEEVCREQIITKLFLVEGKLMIFLD